MATSFRSFLFTVAVIVFFFSAATADRSRLENRVVPESGYVMADPPLPRVLCNYTILIQTGYDFLAGTDSKISVTVTGIDMNSFTVENIESWGQMDPGHNYFEWGTLDIFQGSADCISEPFCRVKVSSDGTGINPAWKLQSVSVSYTGKNKVYQFYVDQWLEDGNWSITKEVCGYQHKSREDLLYSVA